MKATLIFYPKEAKNDADDYMPGLDAETGLMRIKKEFPNLKIIVNSLYGIFKSQ